MTKKDYSNWSKNELIRELKKTEKRKKYGIVWEDKPEEVAELCKTKLPVLKEDENKAVVTDRESQTNILIEGDNYHALSVLNYTHKGAIDIIYIDPPYNTGAKDWKYNNHYVDINDQWRHSKWLSFMDKRLRLAKNLLTSNGVLICAIDDNEIAAVSLLLEEIFPNKILNTVVISSNPHGVSRSGFSRTHEYALFLLSPGYIVNKKQVPEDVREINLRRSGNNSLRTDSPTMFYPIIIDKKSLKVVGAGEVPQKDFHTKLQNIEKGNIYEVWPIDSKGIEKNWYYSKKRVQEKGSLELFTKKIKGQINVYFNHTNNSEQTYKSVWISNKYDAGAYGATLVKTITKTNFPFPKSVNTVYDCIKAVSRSKKDIILDFFAGSGTTGHAVLILNSEDNGNRKFILCTNNEDNNGDGAKIAEDICYPRIVKVSKGYKKDDGEKVPGLGGNIKYFKTKFVDAESTDQNKRELVDKSTEMLCLKEDCFNEAEKGQNFRTFTNGQDKHLGIIYDDDGIESFKKEVKKLNQKFVVYVFSLDDSVREEEFEDVKKLVELKPIPAVILNVYKRIFK